MLCLASGSQRGREISLSGDIGQGLETFLVVTAWKDGASGIWWVEAPDAVKHLAMNRASPENEDLSDIKYQ